MDFSKLTNTQLFELVYSCCDKALLSEDNNCLRMVDEALDADYLSENAKKMVMLLLRIFRDNTTISICKTITMVLCELFEIKSDGDLMDNNLTADIIGSILDRRSKEVK